VEQFYRNRPLSQRLTSLIELEKRMDVQKTMEFILERQAAFAAGMQELEARSLAHQADLETHTEWLSGLSGALQRLTDQMQDGLVKVAAENKETREELKIQRENLNIQRENLNILFRTVQDMIPRLPKQ
jgi:hypothetical protein